MPFGAKSMSSAAPPPSADERSRYRDYDEVQGHICTLCRRRFATLGKLERQPGLARPLQPIAAKGAEDAGDRRRLDGRELGRGDGRRDKGVR